MNYHMGVFSSYRYIRAASHRHSRSTTRKTLFFLMPLPICSLTIYTAVNSNLASTATFEINNFRLGATTSYRLPPFTPTAMEAKLRITVGSTARKVTKSYCGRAEAISETEVWATNETYRRQKFHNVEYLIMSLKIGSLDNNNTFARETQGCILLL